MKFLLLSLTYTALTFPASAAAADQPPKGLLSEIRLNEKNEDGNQEKAFKSEVLITKAENKAIDALKAIIKKKTGTPEEADLLYRLAELYMRRAKSGRYFDLESTSENKLKDLGLKNQKAADALKQAVQIYGQIKTKFPKYRDLDYVLFNDALAHAQLQKVEIAKQNYLQLLSQFPQSELVPDSLLEVGEIFYQQQNFQTALEKFKAIEKFPESKAYPYGLYKSAWCYYNLRQTDAGINQLIFVVKQNPADEKDVRKYNLRKEALRDLTLFVGETLPPGQLVGFFKKIATEDELGESVYGLTGLYESHSRFREMLVFLDEFINSYPNHGRSPQLFAKYVETLETLKMRDQVIKKLAYMAQFCSEKKDAVDCKSEFKKISLEISKKWWDIWLKNKTNAEFSNLTQRAFEILLSIDDEQQPDSKSRFAYAELLFQQDKFTLSSEQYEKVSLQKTVDKEMKHDALYGAVFSIEKMLEKNESAPALIEKEKQLALRYVAEFKNGEHFNQLTYKLGYIFYRQNQIDTSLGYLDPLVKVLKSSDLRLKSEDIILDIYNIKKDYVTLRKRARDFAAGAGADRQTALGKIEEEAHYAQTQLEAKSLPIDKQIEALMNFSKAHQNSRLAQDAFWQSISLAYANGLEVLGADLSSEYVKKFPKDVRNADATKEALKSYLESGHLEKAIANLKEFGDGGKQELICDLYFLNGSKDEAGRCYLTLFKSANAKTKSSLLDRLFKIYPDKKSAEFKEIQSQINAHGIEPYATEYLIQQAEALLEKGDDKSAFSMSLKINARPVDEDVRAGARLIQAAILEKEFVGQSVKAREDKLSMVIAMKTEKMDKSFTAFSSALKMSKQPRIQLKALEGIDRLYSHYVDAISNMPLPDSLSEADRKALRSELDKVVSPFKEKQKAGLQRIAELRSGLSGTKSPAFDWAKLPAEKTFEIGAKSANEIAIENYFPADWKSEGKPARQRQSTGRCSPDVLKPESLNACIVQKNYKAADEMALQLSSARSTRALGLYYRSIITDRQGQFDKALWMINKSLEADSRSEMAVYQRAKVQFSVEDFNTALEGFEKLINRKTDIPEAAVVIGNRRFSERDFQRVSEIFSGISDEELYNYGVDSINIEAKLQIGQVEQALKAVETSLRLDKNSTVANLLAARIFEVHKFDKEKAIKFYNVALEKSKSADQKQWISKKIDFLKNNKTNQIMSYVGGK